MRNPRIVIGASVVAAAFGATLLLMNDDASILKPWRSGKAALNQQAGREAGQATEKNRDGQGTRMQSAVSRKGANPVSADSAEARIGNPFSYVPKVRDALPLDDDPFGAQSKEEQQWLDRNGYPNMRQIEAYTKAPDGMLQQATDAGDAVARVMLEERRLRRGDPNAEANLMIAAAEGSIYALNVLAGYYGQKGARTNPVKAYSLTRVMEMLGDYKVPLTRQFVVGQPLNPAQQSQAEADALGMYRNLIQQRKRSAGITRITIEPRPI